MVTLILAALITAVHAISYDYIVCGGGTAGTALAYRLAQASNYTVLLIEAGPSPDVEPALEVPAAAITNAGGLTDWNFTTVPQNGVPVIQYTRGRVLGGSSQYNYLTYTRGPAAYYDYLAGYLDDESWSWNATFPYFQKSLNVTPPENRKAPGQAEIYGAHGGPLQVDYRGPLPGSAILTAQAYEDFLNLSSIDFNDGNVLGYSQQALTVSPQTGFRSSSWASFGLLGQDLPNFHVLTGSMVSKVIFANSKRDWSGSKRVSGIQYINTLTNAMETVYVNKEVILSAGFIQTPQLLQLSGIGPESVLKQLQVPCEIDLPAVGQNLQDHVLITAMLMVQNITTAQSLIQAANIADLIGPKAFGDQSPFSSNLGGPIGFEHIEGDTLTTPSQQWPNQEWIGTSPVNLSAISQTNVFEPSVVVLAPTSRGNISLVSNNILDKPLLYTNYLSTTEDQQFAIDSYRRLQDYIHSPTISEYLVSSMPSQNQYQTDAEILAYIQQSLLILYHGCCTAAAGPNSTAGVVNSKFMVHGTANLRVVDTSVLPRIVPAHTQAVVYMMAEKAADDILAGVVA